MKPEQLFLIRKEYCMNSLNEEDVTDSPIAQFKHWWKDAEESQVPEFNAMSLASTGKDGMADARTVLLKAFDERGFVFFTNYNSVKSEQLEYNNKCCLLFYWKELERQVRINGIAEKVTLAESIEYFNSRPAESQLGAWASPQSMVVAGKSWLKETFQYYSERFKHGKIPKPPHWGGYRIVPVRIEFWQGRPGRMHDRILYSQTASKKWEIKRLAP
jgi:pyridoxamine 5'-phosphate oxidase